MRARSKNVARWRILIIDKHPLVRSGLIALLNSAPDLSVCGAAASHQVGLNKIATCKPDLVITDLSLEDGDGLRLVKDIRSNYGDLPVLVLTMQHSPRCVRLVSDAGANGCVSKHDMTETLLIAIRNVLDERVMARPQFET